MYSVHAGDLKSVQHCHFVCNINHRVHTSTCTQLGFTITEAEQRLYIILTVHVLGFNLMASFPEHNKATHTLHDCTCTLGSYKSNMP